MDVRAALRDEIGPAFHVRPDQLFPVCACEKLDGEDAGVAGASAIASAAPRASATCAAPALISSRSTHNERKFNRRIRESGRNCGRASLPNKTEVMV